VCWVVGVTRVRSSSQETTDGCEVSPIAQVKHETGVGGGARSRDGWRRVDRFFDAPRNSVT
jgi:hypothetical protein